MPKLTLNIALSAERLLAVYQGRANRVQALTHDGRRVSLPASHLRPHLTRDGIHGSFELEYTEAGELLSLRRLEHR